MSRRAGPEHKVFGAREVARFSMCPRMWHYEQIMRVPRSYTPREIFTDALLETVAWIIEEKVAPRALRHVVGEYESRLRVKAVTVDATGRIQDSFMRALAEGARFLSQFILLELPAMKSPHANKEFKREILGNLERVIHVRAVVPIVERAQVGFLRVKHPALIGRAAAHTMPTLPPHRDLEMVLCRMAANSANYYVITFNRKTGLVEREFHTGWAGVERAEATLRRIDMEREGSRWQMCHPGSSWCGTECAYYEQCQKDIRKENRRKRLEKKQHAAKEAEEMKKGEINPRDENGNLL